MLSYYYNSKHIANHAKYSVNNHAQPAFSTTTYYKLGPQHDYHEAIFIIK